MRVLVTGGAGFVGTNLVRRLLSNGHTPIVFDDFSTGLLSNVDELDIEIIEGHVQDRDAVVEAMQHVDVVVHLAARGSVPRSIRNPIATHEANATGTLNVLEAARAHGAKVIFSSSSSVYGANQELPKIEEMWTAPLTPYAASKLAGEGYARAYAESFDLPVVVFRFFNIFGPWQRPDHDYAAVIPRWLWRALQGQEIRVFGDGSVTRDFTFVDDVVDVLTRSIETEMNHPSPINLAFGQRISLNEVIHAITQVTGANLDVQYEDARAGDIAHSQNNPALLNSLFPDLRPRDFSEALSTTSDWLRDFGSRVAGGPPVAD